MELWTQTVLEHFKFCSTVGAKPITLLDVVLQVCRGNRSDYRKQERVKEGKVSTLRMSTPVNCDRYACVTSRTTTSKAVQCTTLKNSTEKSYWGPARSGSPRESKKTTKNEKLESTEIK